MLLEINRKAQATTFKIFSFMIRFKKKNTIVPDFLFAVKTCITSASSSVEKCAMINHVAFDALVEVRIYDV